MSTLDLWLSWMEVWKNFCDISLLIKAGEPLYLAFAEAFASGAGRAASFQEAGAYAGWRATPVRSHQPPRVTAPRPGPFPTPSPPLQSTKMLASALPTGVPTRIQQLHKYAFRGPQAARGVVVSPGLRGEGGRHPS